MPPRITTDASGSRGKSKYRYKHYHRKNNSNTSNRYTRQRDTSPSHPETKYKHPKAPARSSSKGRNVTRANLTPPPRYNQRKPWVEPGSITILRRQDGDKPKGYVPSWLADTFESLPKKHPLRETVSDSAVTESTNLFSVDDDDNPFAYRPPSPSPTPSNTQDLAFPYPAQMKHSTLSNRTGLSSIPFAPPTFIEPTYEDHYRDTIMPLNDFDNDYDPGNSASSPIITSGDHGSGSVLPTYRVAPPRFATPQQMSSPIFMPGGYPSSPIATTPIFNTISSDDITLPTPTHHSTLIPETDEIQDALCANHPFVTSMYASSPTGSFRGLPLDALVGSGEFPPYGLISPSRIIPMSDAAHRQIWTPKKRVLPEIHVPGRPMSSDVYKSRLLAYATAVADQMSNSGDEDPVEQQTNKHINLSGTKRVAASPRTASSFGLLDNRISNTLPEDLGLSGYTEDHIAMPGPYAETLDPNDRTKLKRTEPLDSGRLDHSTDRTQLTPLKFGAFDNGRSDELVPTNLDSNSDITCAYLEDHEKEYQSDDAIDELEEDDPLVSEYEVVQEDYDVLAADEPSDDEGGPTEQHQATALRQGSEWEHSVPDMVDAASKMFEAPKRDPRIQPFPMKVSCHSPVRNPTAPDKNQPMLSRLSPKFIPRHSRHVQPSPFSIPFKQESRDYPSAVGPKGQDDVAAVGVEEDEIRPWSG